MAGIPSLSDLLGYTSIAFWLGAQFPQLLENVRNQSCEGLALPFLANWALGDISNLVGCILTHQLPFQTWLASYFCCVDISLVTQYFYYGYLKPKPRPYPRSLRTVPSTVRRMSIDRGASHYRTLSAVAANIAATAALAAHQDEQLDPRYTHHRIRRSSSQLHEASSSHVRGDQEDDEDDVWAPMTASFHSERGAGSSRKRVSWSTERFGRRGGSVGRHFSRANIVDPDELSPLEQSSDLERGRPLARETSESTGLPVDDGRVATHSRASRKGATMVFLAFWALFGIGTLTDVKESSSHIGRVLSRPNHPVIHVPTPYKPPLPTALSIPIPFDDTRTPEHTHDAGARGERPDTERIIGRISAWLCTTLYLTSRLPQIWKNYVRKSVEGLSMYLFVFAFLGNSFYVASILSSPQLGAPPPQSTMFLRESLPYLFGSAGTLIFDIVIISQSFIYKPKPSHRRHRRSTTAAGHEEETALLGGEALAGSVDSLARSKHATSPTRTRNIV